MIMLSEYNTEFLDKTLYMFINICKELICSSLPWKTATTEVIVVYTAQAWAPFL